MCGSGLIPSVKIGGLPHRLCTAVAFFVGLLVWASIGPILMPLSIEGVTYITFTVSR